MAGFGLLGKHLPHSFSPQLHGYFGDYSYELFEVMPDSVAEFIRKGKFDGINITIPYKKTVLELCDTLSEEARRIGSVNTIIRTKDGAAHGENTDYYGFLYMLKRSGAEVRGKKTLVLGSGGAALAVTAVLRDACAGEIVIISRSGYDNYDNLNRHADTQIIVNTTPVGMYPACGVSPVDLDVFPNLEAVLDIVYNPARTELLLDSEDRGIPCMGGLCMLVAQAKRASELFTGKRIPDERIDEVTEKLARKTKNTALIGMPGSGKSSVGRKLAELCPGREFFDIDQMVEKEAGRSIGQIFAVDGESVFRAMETRALRKIAGKSGCIIATGGGIIKNEENLRLLRQNSVTVFLERELAELPTTGRPLSLSEGIGKLYGERLPLYKQWSEYTVSSKKGVFMTAQAVKEALDL